MQRMKPHNSMLPVRIRTAIDDVSALRDLHADAAAGARFLKEPTSQREVKLMFAAGRRADALHRAIIEAAHRAVTIALHEVHGRPGREVTVARMLSRPTAARLSEQAVWQRLYCLGVYRNKIVAHNEMARMAASQTSADGVRRLAPLSEGWRVSGEDATRLRRIRDATGLGAVLDNDFELLEHLFYEVAVRFGQPQSAMRLELDKMLEQGGVKSPSVAEVETWVLAALDDLLDTGLLRLTSDEDVER